MTFRAGASAVCPHCRRGIRLEAVEMNGKSDCDSISLLTPGGHALSLSVAACPSCMRPILAAIHERPNGASSTTPIDVLLWPDAAARPIPPEVESAAPELAVDYREAAAVCPKSKKASAALSRRCLQYVLVNKGLAKTKDLASQIDEVLPSLPYELGLNVDAIRQVGNFAAHPMKATSSGQIAAVEEGEAEWLLDVLEELFEHYYVAPAQASARRDALNKKLADLKKPPLKSP